MTLLTRPAVFRYRSSGPHQSGLVEHQLLRVRKVMADEAVITVSELHYVRGYRPSGAGEVQWSRDADELLTRHVG